MASSRRTRRRKRATPARKPVRFPGSRGRESRCRYRATAPCRCGSPCQRALTHRPVTNATRPSIAIVLRWSRESHPSGLSRCSGLKPRTCTPAVDERFPERARAERPEPVVDDMDPHAGARPLRQRVDELATDGIVVEDVAFEQDRPLRPADGLEPGGEVFRPVTQQTDGIAVDRIGTGRTCKRAVGERERKFERRDGIGQVLLRAGCGKPIVAHRPGIGPFGPAHWRVQHGGLDVHRQPTWRYDVTQKGSNFAPGSPLPHSVEGFPNE